MYEPLNRLRARSFFKMQRISSGLVVAGLRVVGVDDPAALLAATTLCHSNGNSYSCVSRLTVLRATTRPAKMTRRS